MIGMISSSAWHKIFFTAGLSGLGSFVSLPEFLKETSPTVLLDFHKTWQMFNMTSNSVDLNFYGLSAFGMCPSVLLCFRHPMERCFYFVFYSKWKKLICDWQYHQKTFVVSVSMFCFKYLLQNQFYGQKWIWPKANWIFGNFLSRNIFCFFFTDFKLLMFRNYTVKISEVLNKWNLLKTCIDFCLFCSHFYWGKQERKHWIFIKPMTGIKLFVHKVLSTYGFALNHAKSLLIHFCVKCQAQNDFLKDVKRRLVCDANYILLQFLL